MGERVKQGPMGLRESSMTTISDDQLRRFSVDAFDALTPDEWKALVKRAVLEVLVNDMKPDVRIQLSDHMESERDGAIKEALKREVEKLSR